MRNAIAPLSATAAVRAARSKPGISSRRDSGSRRDERARTNRQRERRGCPPPDRRRGSSPRRLARRVPHPAHSPIDIPPARAAVRKHDEQKISVPVQRQLSHGPCPARFGNGEARLQNDEPPIRAECRGRAEYRTSDRAAQNATQALGLGRRRHKQRAAKNQQDREDRCRGPAPPPKRHHCAATTWYSRVARPQFAPPAARNASCSSTR